MSIDATATQQDLIAGTWVIDPSHSEVGFTVRHLMSKVRGQFEKFEGQIVSTGSLADAKATASIDLASVNTRDAQRDGHIRSGDFFDVENHGPMTFTTTSVKQGDEGLVAVGELTIKGITNPVELDVEFLGVDKDAYGNTVAGFEASTQISRKAWGVDFNVPLDGGKVLVGDKVSLVLTVQARLQQGE